MKGVVLAGGLGTRLYPLTHATNKHLLPVYNKPMVFYPFNTLVKAGITEVMVVVGGPHAGDFIQVLKNGKDLGLEHLEYSYQEKEGGIADALALARDFADGENLTVILGDNTTDVDISVEVKNFSGGAHIFLKEVIDPKRYGIALFDENDNSKLVKIVEKPQDEKNKLAVAGLYIYDNQVFSYIDKCSPSARNELEITDVNNFYISAGTMKWSKLTGFWSDTGTFQSLYQANKYWAEKEI